MAIKTVQDAERIASEHQSAIDDLDYRLTAIEAVVQLLAERANPPITESEIVERLAQSRVSRPATTRLAHVPHPSLPRGLGMAVHRLFSRS